MHEEAETPAVVIPLHKCELEKPYNTDKHGNAVEVCWEDKQGVLWAGNDEYANTVSFCPFCGYNPSLFTYRAFNHFTFVNFQTIVEPFIKSRQNTEEMWLRDYKEFVLFNLKNHNIHPLLWAQNYYGNDFVSNVPVETILMKNKFITAAIMLAIDKTSFR